MCRKKLCTPWGKLQAEYRPGWRQTAPHNEVLNNIYFWEPAIETLKDSTIALFIFSRESHLNGTKNKTDFYNTAIQLALRVAQHPSSPPITKHFQDNGLFRLPKTQRQNISHHTVWKN